MVYAGDTVYGSKATITNAVKYLQNQGKTVIGGTNADFFVMSSGVPIGLVIDKGTLISSDAWQYAVGFKKDGTAVIGRPTMGIRITGASGSCSVSYFNKTRTTAGAYLLDRSYDEATHFAAKGSYIVLEREDSTPVKAGGSVKLKVVSKGTGSSSFAIGENQMVLTKSDGANVPSWVDFPVGEEVTLSITAADPAWSEVEYAVGGKLLIDDGTVTTSGIDAASFAPRAQRHRRQERWHGRPVRDRRQPVLGQHRPDCGRARRRTQGAWLCSRTLSRRRRLLRHGAAPARRERDLAHLESLGRPQRACANYIFFTANTPSDGVTAHAVLTPSYRYLLPGASTWFSIKGADASYAPAEAPADLVFEVSNDMGTVEGQTFTAGQKSGSATITASNGSVSGSMNVCVTGDVQSIALQSGGRSVSSVSVKPGQSVDLDALGYHLGQKMASADTAFTWTVSGGIGSVDEKGVFTAGSSMASGTLTCSYGNTRASIPVNVGMGDPQDACSSRRSRTVSAASPPRKAFRSRASPTTPSVARGTGSLRRCGTAKARTASLCPFPRQMSQT